MSTYSLKRIDNRPTNFVYNGQFDDWLDTLKKRVKGDFLVEAYRIQRKAEEGPHFWMYESDIRAFLKNWYVEDGQLTQNEAEKMFGEVKR